MRKSNLRLWTARLAIAAVVGWNLECALAFWLDPGRYATGFELAGTAGEAAVRGMAVLFVMWNVPYLAALWHPRKHKISLWEALVMQVVGLAGESLILFFLPAGHTIMQAALLRFIIFDAAGALLLTGAILLTGNRPAVKDKL